MKMYGIAVGDSGFGAGDLVEVVEYMGISGELQAKTKDGEWLPVYQVFTVEGDITVVAT